MLRVLIADDHAILRRGLIEILAHEFKGAVWGEAATAEGTLAEVRNHDWDLVILDLNMPGRSGVDILADLKRLRPKLPVLVLSTYPEEQFGKRMLQTGASGYLTKSTTPEELVKAMRKVLAGGRYVSAALAEKLAWELGQNPEQLLHESLSNRELEVLRMLAFGKTVTQTAEELHLSQTTVSTYRTRILEKMKMSSSVELMNYALRHHLAD
jgi:DNA-binding NarL/FixJ family response regulator